MLFSGLLLMTACGFANCQGISLPSVIIDSIIFRLDQGVACDSLSKAQQTEINSLNGLISAQSIQISNQKELISTQAQKIALSAEQLQAERELGRVRKGIAQKRIKSVRRWLGVSVGVNVLLVVLLL